MSKNKQVVKFGIEMLRIEDKGGVVEVWAVVKWFHSEELNRSFLIGMIYRVGKILKERLVKELGDVQVVFSFRRVDDDNFEGRTMIIKDIYIQDKVEDILMKMIKDGVKNIVNKIKRGLR